MSELLQIARWLVISVFLGSKTVGENFLTLLSVNLTLFTPAKQ